MNSHLKDFIRAFACVILDFLSIKYKKKLTQNTIQYKNNFDILEAEKKNEG